MRWQQKARLAIAAFTIVFAAVVFVAMRQRARIPPAPADTPRTDQKAMLESGALVYNSYKGGKVVFSVRCERQYVYEGGRIRCLDVKLSLPDRNGRSIEVTGKEADVTKREDNIGTAHIRGNLRLTTSDGIVVTAGEARYDDKEGIVRVPGPVQFTRGRLSGKGVGATYDKNRDVLWLLDQAQVFVAPDETGGGKAEASAGSAGLARADHYLRLTRAAHVVAEGRTIDADEITALLTPDDQKVQMMQLRGHSRITGTGNAPQNMAANDIDLTYGADGRTLQHARLMEHAVVELAAGGEAAARRISGKTIELALAPDGAAVTDLKAATGVQVDLPAAGETPARQIRSATLSAAGSPATGLQTATFDGGVDYRETRPAGRGSAATERHATASRLMVQTKPGFGELQQADFRGNVKFLDGQTTGEAPRAVYQVEADRLELSPSNGDPGPPPTMSDPQVTVRARTIGVVLGTRKLSAETDVRSTLQPRRRQGTSSAATAGPAASAEPQSRMPSMLKQDEPVNVTSNRLEYDGAASQAIYTGNARLWQGETDVRADVIRLDDKTGNLVTRGSTRTRMMLEDTDPKTKQRTMRETIATADSLNYEDSRRLAIYTANATTRARIVGPQGDVTGDRIELHLKESGNELESAEAFGKVVVVEEQRTARGDHLTYTASDDTYVLTGAPVEVVEQSPSGCQKTLADAVKFARAVDRIETQGNSTPTRTTTVPCPERRF